MHKTTPTTHFYVVGPNGEFGDVIVYLQGMDGKSTGARPRPPCSTKKAAFIRPTILAVQTGQKIIVKNSDTCIHNVHAMPTVAGNQEFNDAQMPGGADLTYTFPKPEMFLKFQCDVHPWMFAWVSVFDQPVFLRERQGRKIHHQKCAARQIHHRRRHRKLGHADAGRGSQGRQRDGEFHVCGKINFKLGKPLRFEKSRRMFFR